MLRLLYWTVICLGCSECLYQIVPAFQQCHYSALGAWLDCSGVIKQLPSMCLDLVLQQVTYHPPHSLVLTRHGAGVPPVRRATGNRRCLYRASISIGSWVIPLLCFYVLYLMTYLMIYLMCYVLSLMSHLMTYAYVKCSYGFGSYLAFRTKTCHFVTRVDALPCVDMSFFTLVCFVVCVTLSSYC